MNFNKIVQPTTLKEAYDLINSEESCEIIGGGIFLKLNNKNVELGLDLSNIPINKIEKTNNIINIGAMVTLRELEKDNRLPACITEAVKQIGSVGLRNMATLGGSICGKYPFSDLNTALLSLGVKLNFYKFGEIDFEEYLNSNVVKKDILSGITFSEVEYSVCRFHKLTYTDFSLVNISVTLGNEIRIAVGARPGKAVLLSDINTKHSAKELLEEIKFGDDYRGSGEYRRAVAESLLSDIFEEGYLWK